MTRHIWDGMNISADVSGGTVNTYIRGINLLRATIGGVTQYYLYNAHGDVIQLVDGNGAVTKTYAYDAFGVEQGMNSDDINPWRYGAEYFDKETGQVYLRARYYQPVTSRMLSEDTHWNPHNMICGDDPLTAYGHDVTTERDFYRTLARQLIIEQVVGNIFLKTGMTSTDKILEAQRWRMGQLTGRERQYVEYRVGEIRQPSINAIMQSVNLYVYCMGNPVTFSDPSGNYVGTTVLLLATGALGYKVKFDITPYYTMDGNQRVYSKVEIGNAYSSGFGPAVQTNSKGIEIDSEGNINFTISYSCYFGISINGTIIGMYRTFVAGGTIDKYGKTINWYSSET